MSLGPDDSKSMNQKGTYLYTLYAQGLCFFFLLLLLPRSKSFDPSSCIERNSCAFFYWISPSFLFSDWKLLVPLRRHIKPMVYLSYPYIDKEQLCITDWWWRTFAGPETCRRDKNGASRSLSHLAFTVTACWLARRLDNFDESCTQIGKSPTHGLKHPGCRTCAAWKSPDFSVHPRGVVGETDRNHRDLSTSR